jgi:hypothetical protein
MRAWSGSLFFSLTPSMFVRLCCRVNYVEGLPRPAAENADFKEEEMTNRRWLHVALGVVILGLLSTASTGAIWNVNRTTYFTFTHAVQIPGASLPAGTYVFELATPNAPDVVRVRNKEYTKVYLTAFTRLVERPHSKKLDATIVFSENAAGTPRAIKVWYPEDESTGRQFIY